MDEFKTPSQPPARVHATAGPTPPSGSRGRVATTRGGRSVQLAPLRPLTQPLTSLRTTQTPSGAGGRSWAQVVAGQAAAPRSERKARIPGSPPGQPKAGPPQAGAGTPALPPAFPALIKACMAEPDAASARTRARALAMSLGEEGVEAGREAFLQAWLDAMATSPLERTAGTLSAALEGFASFSPKDPQRACAWIGAAVPRLFEHFAQVPTWPEREAVTQRMGAMLDVLTQACGAAAMAPAALAALLAAIDPPASQPLPAADARQWLGARNVCFEAVLRGVCRPSLRAPLREVIGDHLLARASSAERRADLLDGWLQAMGGRSLPPEVGRSLLAYLWSRMGEDDPAFEAVAAAFFTLGDDPREAAARLLDAAASLPPALAARLMAYLVGALRPAQADADLAAALCGCAPACGPRQVTVLAAAHAMASGAQAMDSPAWEAFLTLYPADTQAAAYLGARMAVEPLLVFEQARLKPHEQLGLLESVYAIPGLLNRRAVSAALLTSLGVQVGSAQRLKLLELLFERGGAWLGLHHVRMARKMLGAQARIEGEPLGLATAQALARWYAQGAGVEPPAADIVREELAQVQGMRLSDDERATLMAALQAMASRPSAPVARQVAAPLGAAPLTTLALADALPLAGPRPLDED